MSATGWPAYRQLLLQLVRDQAAYRTLKRVSIILLAGALLIVAVALCFGKPLAGKGLLALFLWANGQMWCSAFLKGAIAQNRPEYASLVPQLRVRLIRLTAALCIASSLLLGLSAALLFGHGGYALLVGGMMNVYILFTTRHGWLAFSPAAIFLPLTQTDSPDKIALALHHGLGEPAVAALGSLLLLALGAWGLRTVFPQGGDAHWAWFKRHLRNKDAVRSPSQLVPLTRLGAWWQAMRSSRYQAELRADSRNGGTPQRMMIYALGPGAHPAGYVTSVAGNTLIALAVLALADGHVKPGVFALMGIIAQWSILMAALMYITSVVDGAQRYRTEQEIFFLSAGAPAQASINRLLGGAMLRGFFTVWLATLASVAGIDWLVHGAAGLRGVTFMLATLILPLACMMLRNYLVMATVSSPSWSTLLVLYAIVCNVLLSVVSARFEVPWFWLGGAVAVLSLLELYRRWRKLLALPPVLPAGRLAV
ncbi:hypothetical protein KW842_04710 [Duganella sp. sic0402]|uniref:hypothetical protein n=1 Tax=Duganella sp. sic0402 TaxID=2854786 RepID=UPI001C457EB5|nr:hypothetical protein [Duganella sp. sic0402]MBV7535068.1 hypothetical protein [Duganella sp. sic0402]